MTFDKSKWIKIIESAKNKPLDDQSVADLVIELSSSGKQISLPFENTADVPSTGGPSSLSTLLSPLILVKAGYIVPKLGVPGRPAGGLDALSQIHGYKIELSQQELEKILSKSCYAHFISSGKYAPLDLEVFSLRKEMGAIAVPGLVIASILAKKIALNVKNIGLDVRIASHGNFGENFNTGRINARQFIRVSKLLGLKSICILTDAKSPFQPFIGRGEALWALNEIYNESSSNWLLKHTEQCKKIIEVLSGKRMEIKPSELQQIFKDNLEAQGANYGSFLHKVKQVKKEHHYKLEAKKSGYVSYDLAKLRGIIVEIQELFSKSSIYSDPCGVRLLYEPQKIIEKGQEIMSIRVPSNIWKLKRQDFEQSFNILNMPMRIYTDEVIYDG